MRDGKQALCKLGELTEIALDLVSACSWAIRHSVCSASESRVLAVVCHSQVLPADYIWSLVCGYAAPHRERKLLLMLNGYIDDSGSEPSTPTFVLAGYVLPAEIWAHFSDEWDKELLRDKPINYLHMKEIGKDFKGGQFDGWTFDEIEGKLKSLAGVIQNHNPFALAAHAQWSEYEKFKMQSSRGEYLQSPYKALFYEITKIMYGAGRIWNNPNSVDFVFDEQGEIGDEAASWYLEIKDAYPPEARAFFGAKPVFRDDSLVLPLQAADMLAWFQRRRICQPVTRPGWMEIEGMITRGFTIGSEIDADSFEKAARRLRACGELAEEELISLHGSHRHPDYRGIPWLSGVTVA